MSWPLTLGHIDTKVRLSRRSAFHFTESDQINIKCKEIRLNSEVENIRYALFKLINIRVWF
jgi:hypothetical protein